MDGDGFERPRMHTVLGQLIEHPNWASRSWVDATLIAVGEAIREAGPANGEIAQQIDQAESATDPDEWERILISALEGFGHDHELRTLGLRFMKLREQFRPIWSTESSGLPADNES